MLLYGYCISHYPKNHVNHGNPVAKVLEIMVSAEVHLATCADATFTLPWHKNVHFEAFLVSVSIKIMNSSPIYRIG